MPRVRGETGDPRLPCEWPAWLLTYGRGMHPDPVVQHVLTDGFHRWQARRNEWVRTNRPDLSVAEFLRLAQVERVRRARSLTDAHYLT